MSLVFHPESKKMFQFTRKHVLLETVKDKTVATETSLESWWQDLVLRYQYTTTEV